MQTASYLYAIILTNTVISLKWRLSFLTHEQVAPCCWSSPRQHCFADRFHFSVNKYFSSSNVRNFNLFLLSPALLPISPLSLIYSISPFIPISQIFNFLHLFIKCSSFSSSSLRILQTLDFSSIDRISTKGLEVLHFRMWALLALLL